MAKPYNFVNVDGEYYGLQCPYCRHTVSVMDVIFGDFDYSVCQFCKKEIDISVLDYDELLEFAEGQKG